ncbi:hypothetical protein ACWGJ9_08115 [Curtobacterium citreum]
MTDFSHPALDAATATARTRNDDADYQQWLTAAHAIFLSLLHTTEYKADYVDAETVSRDRPDHRSGALYAAGVRLHLHGGSSILVSVFIDAPDRADFNVYVNDRTPTAKQQFTALQPYIAGVLQGALAAARTDSSIVA